MWKISRYIMVPINWTAKIRKWDIISKQNKGDYMSKDKSDKDSKDKSDKDSADKSDC